MNKHFKIKASDLDRILNISKEPYQSVDSQYIDGDDGKNREIIRILAEDDYITIRLKREINDYVVFSITEKGKYFMLLGGYTALEKKKKREKIKAYISNIMKFIVGAFIPKILILLFHIIILQ